MNIALKIDVHTYRGTREGVPVLVDLLKQVGAGASFVFTVGPDSGGRRLRHALRARIGGKRVPALLAQFGWRNLISGVLVPAPDIGESCAEEMRAVKEAGFEIGVSSFEEAAWLALPANATEATTRWHMEQAMKRYREVFGTLPHMFAATGWRMNRHAFRLTQKLGFDYCADTLGTQPYVPIYQAEVVVCPQIPTTLPTLDRLLDEGRSPETSIDRILDMSAHALPSGHVYTAHAELEGGKFVQQFERLLQTWKGRGVNLLSLADYFDALPNKDLPRHEIAHANVLGMDHEVTVQGKEFLL